MTIPIPKTDETAMNMTPMIDIVFNLVIFFMLTLDLSQKEFAEVELPQANSGSEIKEEPDAQAPTFVINLLPDGNVQFKGQIYELASPDPRKQDEVLVQLRQALWELASNPKWKEPDGASMVKVLIHGDRGAKWQYAQWIMQVCANEKIKIYQIQFAVKHKVVEN